MSADPGIQGCPSDDTLGALVQHALDADERARVTAHIDECASCQQLMIAVVREVGRAATAGTPPERGDEPPPDSDDTTRQARSGEPAPARFGRYELGGLLGAGGMGTVYVARDHQLDREIAIKVLKPDLSDAPGFADRFVRESRLMAKIAHPSVITVYDAGRHDGAVFIAMELVRGSTLTAWLAANPVSWRAIVALFERAGRGLEAAHRAGIVHRDFKPDNVLVDRDAHKIVVTDFGIARETAGPALDAAAAGAPAPPPGPRAPQITTDGAAVGTPAYMAPEQITGRAVDPRADVFAFAVSLWEALFRERPFRGSSTGEIYTNMQAPPTPPAGKPLPRRLVRALRRGLAIDPGKRWPDMASLLDELAAVRARRRRVAVATAAAGLVGLGLAAALVASPAAVDPCVRGAAALDEAYNARLAGRAGDALAADPVLQAEVTAKLAATAEAWRTTHRTTCDATRAVAQDPTITACLDARRLELAAVVDDLSAHGAAGAPYARLLISLVSPPASCATRAPGLLFARVPADRALRRQVTALRTRLYDAGLAAERGDRQTGLAAVTEIVGATAALWPPLHAEALFLQGALQGKEGDSKLANETLRAAAVAGEQGHYDLVAARSWAELAIITANDRGDWNRALEYVAYGEAAAARIARPPSVTSRLAYAKGVALLGPNRMAEAEVAMRSAADLAEAGEATDRLAASIGLADLYAYQHRYRESVAQYRKAIEQLPRSPSGQIVRDVVPILRLAMMLAYLGEQDEAEREARRAVEIADRAFPQTQIDRPLAHLQLAYILRASTHLDEALAEATAAVAAIGAIQGTRSKRYGEALTVQAGLLSDQGHHAAADPLYVRACDVAAFADGEDSADHARCLIEHVEVLGGLRRYAESLAKLNRAIAVLTATSSDDDPEVANAVLARAEVHAALGHHRPAIADFERALAVLATSGVDPGRIADGKYQLARELWASQPARARRELTESLALFATASSLWTEERAAAEAWHKRHAR